MAHPHNSGSTLRIFLKFCTMKGAQRYMELILMVFQKNPHLGQMGHFGLKMARRHKSGSSLRMFLNFCIMKGAERYMKFSLIIFPKIFFWVNGLFWARIKGAKRYMKFKLMVLQKKIPGWGKWVILNPKL